MRAHVRWLALLVTIGALGACSSGKSASGGTTTVVPAARGTSASTTTTTVAGGSTSTTSALEQKFVYQPNGFCQAFSNFIVYGIVVQPLFATALTGTSTTEASAIDARIGAATLLFAPVLAPTMQVLQSDAPEELLPVLRDFDAYNDAAVQAVAALGVDVDALGRSLADELSAMDVTKPETLPTTESVASAARIDPTKLADAASRFVAEHGRLDAVFAKYGDTPDPSPDRQKDLITRYPCLNGAFDNGG